MTPEGATHFIKFPFEWFCPTRIKMLDDFQKVEKTAESAKFVKFEMPYFLITD